MRTNRTMRIGIFLVGIGLVLLVVWMIGAALFSRDAPTVAESDDDGEITPVSTQTRGMRVVAVEPIPGKSIITRDMIAVREAPADAPDGDYIGDPNALLGYVTRDVVINPGDAISRADLLGHITKVGTSGLVRLGERAMVVPLNQPTLHALIKAGDYVDVVAAFEGQEANTIVRGARVLAVDVFANEYPDVSIAQRGAYKHPPANADVNVVPTPTPTADPNAPPAAQQAAPPPSDQAAAVGEDAPPPAAALTLEVTPEEATRISLAQAANARIDFTLIPREEVVVPGAGTRLVDGPEGEVIDGSMEIATATIETVASTILPEVAPYTARLNRQAAGTGQTAGTNEVAAARQDRQQFADRLVSIAERGTEEIVRAAESQSQLGRGPDFGDEPDFGDGVTGPMGPDGLPKPPPTPTPLPETYQVKIIPDGKEVRYETVLKPKN